MRIARAWSMPTKHTFKMAPIRKIIENYIDLQKLWIDPYAGFHSPLSETNDINPSAPTKYHMEALSFVCLYDKVDGVLFDPPYSPRQIHEAYKLIDRRASMQDTQHAARLADVKNELTKRMKPGAIAITCGWNSNGFGKSRGFSIKEILMVAHGAAHNDTLVTVETKL